MIRKLRSKFRHCGCTSKEKGNPKYGKGPCYAYGCVRPAVRDRIYGKRISKEIVKIFRAKFVDIDTINY